MHREQRQAPPQEAHCAQEAHVLREDAVRERAVSHEGRLATGDGLVPLPLLRGIPPHEQEPHEGRREMKEQEAKRNRYQLAKHVYRMRVKSGCTFDEIARAIQCSVKEAQALFKEAMR